MPGGGVVSYLACAFLSLPRLVLFCSFGLVISSHHSSPIKHFPSSFLCSECHQRPRFLLQGCARPSARETTIFPFSPFSILFFPFFPSSLSFFLFLTFCSFFCQGSYWCILCTFSTNSTSCTFFVRLLQYSSCCFLFFLVLFKFSSFVLPSSRPPSLPPSSLTFVCFLSGYTPQSVPHHLSFAPPLITLIPHRRGARVLSLSVPFQVCGFFPWLFLILFDFCLYLSFHSISSSRHHFSLRLLLLLLSRVTENFVCLYIHLRSWANKTHLWCLHHLHSSLDT